MKPEDRKKYEYVDGNGKVWPSYDAWCKDWERWQIRQNLLTTKEQRDLEQIELGQELRHMDKGKRYAPRAKPSTDTNILKVLGDVPLSLAEIIKRVNKPVQSRTVYLRLLALAKQGKVLKQGNAKKARYILNP